MITREVQRLLSARKWETKWHKKVLGMGSFWPAFCSWTNTREQNTTILGMGRKMANIGTLLFQGCISYTKIYFWSMREQTTVCSTLSIILGLKCSVEIRPAGSFLTKCVTFSLLFVEMGYSGRFLNPKFVISFLHSYNSSWHFKMKRGKLFVSTLFSNTGAKRQTQKGRNCMF